MTTKTVNAAKATAKAETKAQPEETLLFKESQLYKTQAELDKAFATHVKQAESAQKGFQLDALSAIAHIVQHGNINTIQNMYDNFPEGSRKDAFGQYFINFAPVTGELTEVTDKSTGKAKKRFIFTLDKAKRKEMQLNGWFNTAASKWWYKTKKQAETSEYDYLTQLIKLAKAGESHLKKPEGKRGNVTAEMVQLTKDLADSLHRKQLAA
jgi:hypothetical protein